MRKNCNWISQCIFIFLKEKKCTQDAQKLVWDYNLGEKRLTLLSHLMESPKSNVGESIQGSLLPLCTP